MMKIEMASEEQWEAIVRNDRSFDGTFLYAVVTTGVFCRPSCKSRAPLRGHIRIFAKPEEALTAGFRPCKRCRPDGEQGPLENWMGQMEQWLAQHFTEPLTLEKLAVRFHASPYHLLRTFKRVHGLTPKAYIHRLRMNKAVELIGSTEGEIAEIAAQLGFGNAAHFSVRFQKETGYSPTAYRSLITSEMKKRMEVK